MKGCWVKHLLVGTVAVMLAACSPKPTNRGRQYKDGRFTQPFSLVNQPDAAGAPINAGNFAEQINHIRSSSPRLCDNQSNVYNAVRERLRAGDDTCNMRQFGINVWQTEGVGNYGNVQFTGYCTSIVRTRHTRQNGFQYPIHRMSPERGHLSFRAEIYVGVLNGKYVLACSSSLMDNFTMDVQDNEYINSGSGSPFNFLSYAGKDGHAYRSTGKVLIDRSEVREEDMLVQAIRHWGETHNETEVCELLEQNPSFVFFKPQSFAPTKGASAVPLVGRVPVVFDRSTIPLGTTLLVEASLLDNNGRSNGQYGLRLIVALGVGSAIKGRHLDIYQGIGPEAGHRAGWYNHYGRVWVLRTAPGVGNIFSG